MMNSAHNAKLKRKNGNTETKAEPARKNLKKADLLNNFDALEHKYLELEIKYSALLKEKDNFIEAINLLEETIKVLEKKRKKSVRDAGVQTEIMRCEDCEFPADSVIDLVDHLH